MFDDINGKKDNLTEDPPSNEDNNALNGSLEDVDNIEEVEEFTAPVIDDTSVNSAENNVEQVENIATNSTESDANSESENDNKNATEENNSISSDLIRGHINTIILRALYERDKYGYEIINDIESKSHGQYTLKQPTLYSALKRLENQGYIKAYWKTDEVTLGGRRKYFTLTESGKAITEKNLAEWEYSRTIIDSLISDKSFDFANPAPNPVDFSLLRDSVSRVPTVRIDDKKPDDVNQAPQIDSSVQQIISQPTQTNNSVSFVQTVDYVQPNSTNEEAKPKEQAAQNGDNVNNQSATQALEEAERRRTHENYLKLISEPVRTKPIVTEDIVPGSDNISSDKLMYNNKPETERDYKNLIDGIFFKTVNNGSVQTTYHSRQSETQQYSQPRRAQNSSHLVDRAASDGVLITPSNERNSSRASKTTYNKGLTLLKSSAVVLAILIVEAVLCFIFMDALAVNWIYPTTILAIGLVQFTVFAIMALNGYGKHSVRPTSNGYIGTCIILTIITLVIIAMLAFLLNMNTALLSDIFKMLVIPAITSLNLTVFSIMFKLFIK
ncbi:MAG: PadR family transcriptional regulator [Candidatus Coproplasma sp.]